MHTRFSIVRAKVASILPPALLIVTNLFIIGPITVFKGNSIEFKFRFFDLSSLYVYPLFSSLFIILIIGILIPLSKNILYSVILFSLGILLWLQGNILVWNYGVFDGTLIDWSKYILYGLVDISVWSLVIITTVILHKKISTHVSFISFSYIILQFLLLFLNNFSSFTRINSLSENHAITSQFNYSSSFNIVHIILDSYQTDIFREITEEDGIADNFEGFTLFEENMSAVSKTKYAVPAIFTGKAYGGDIGEKQYKRQAAEEGFPNLLYQKGYEVNLAPDQPTFGMKYTNYYDIKQIAGISRETEREQSALYLLDISMFRHFPQFLKKYIYNNNNWLLSKLISDSQNNKSFIDKTFLKKYIAGLRINGPRPAYHFIHVQPPHPPYVTREDGTYAGKTLPDTRDNYKNEARYILQLFVELLDEMKRLEIYDSSLIVLQGDHGSNFRLKPKKNDIAPDTLDIYRISALLVVKPPGAKGPLQTSQAPTMVTDIAPTIMEYAGYSFPGTSVFRTDQTSPRTRLYRLFPPTVPRTWRYLLFPKKMDNSYTAYTIEGSLFTSKSLKNVEEVALP